MAIPLLARTTHAIVVAVSPTAGVGRVDVAVERSSRLRRAAISKLAESLTRCPFTWETEGVVGVKKLLQGITFHRYEENLQFYYHPRLSRDMEGLMREVVLASNAATLAQAAIRGHQHRQQVKI